MEILSQDQYEYVKGFIVLHDDSETYIFHVSEIASIEIKKEGTPYKPYKATVRIFGKAVALIIAILIFPEAETEKDFQAFLMCKMQMWAEKKERRNY